MLSHANKAERRDRGQELDALLIGGGSEVSEYRRLIWNCLALELINDFKIRPLSDAERQNCSGDGMNQEKRYAEALGYFEAALESSPRFALAWINKGIALKNLSRLDEAIACYDKVICEIDSHFKKAWHNRAVALILKGDLAGASVCLETALQIDPDYTVAWALRARLEELL